jgi:hypothetical protein
LGPRPKLPQAKPKAYPKLLESTPKVKAKARPKVPDGSGICRWWGIIAIFFSSCGFFK